MTERTRPLREARGKLLEMHRISQGYTAQEYSQIIDMGHAMAFEHIEKNPHIMEDAEEMVKEHFEGILKTRYLNLFGVAGEIEFTPEGKLDWSKLFKLSDKS